jgi:hypothetical protein
MVISDEQDSRLSPEFESMSTVAAPVILDHSRSTSKPRNKRCVRHSPESNPLLSCASGFDDSSDSDQTKHTSNGEQRTTMSESTQSKEKRRRNLPSSTQQPTTSNIVDMSSDEDDVIVPGRSSLVWRYATRCSDPRFATCDLCPSKRRISTNNGSTSTLRQHLISKHGKGELTLPGDKKRSTATAFDPERKRRLHDLLINCIIRDSRTFGDFEKPGMKQVLKLAFPGRFSENGTECMRFFSE